MAARTALRPALLLVPLAACGGGGEDALGTAREAAGSTVTEARALSAGGEQWIAVARPDSAGNQEILLLRRARSRWAPVATGLRATGALWGVADADGDGEPEVWAARIVRTASAARVEVRARAVARGADYLLLAPLGAAGGMDHAQREFSFNVMGRPALQRWLTARAESAAAATGPR